MKTEKTYEWFTLDALHGAIASSLETAQDRLESDAMAPAFAITDCRIEVPVLMQMSRGRLTLRTPGDMEVDARILGRVSLTLRPRLKL